MFSILITYLMSKDKLNDGGATLVFTMLLDFVLLIVFLVAIFGK